MWSGCGFFFGVVVKWLLASALEEYIICVPWDGYTKGYRHFKTSWDEKTARVLSWDECDEVLLKS